jgi:hypothetical protein
MLLGFYADQSLVTSAATADMKVPEAEHTGFKFSRFWQGEVKAGGYEGGVDVAVLQQVEAGTEFAVSTEADPERGYQGILCNPVIACRGGLIRARAGIGHQFGRTDRVAIEVIGAGEIGFIGEQSVLFEVIEAVYLTQDESLQTVIHSGWISPAVGVSPDEELQDCFSGDAFGIEAFGEDAAFEMTPAATIDLVLGEVN